MLREKERETHRSRRNRRQEGELNEKLLADKLIHPRDKLVGVRQHEVLACFSRGSPYRDARRRLSERTSCS